MLIEQREDIEQMDALQIIRYGCTAKITQLHKEVRIFSSYTEQHYHKNYFLLLAGIGNLRDKAET